MNHTMAVTSGMRETGATTSVASLGAVFADAGADVLLVDCDLTDPTLAADLGIVEPGATLRDVFAGRATLQEAVHTGPGGVAVIPGDRFSLADPTIIFALVDAIDGFDIVICDTDDPFSDVTASACDAADGVLVVSTPDDAARRNTAAVHESLRDHGRPLLGTALTRVGSDDDGADWDCELLATIPESDVVADGAADVLDSPSDPGAERYRELARSVSQRLRDGPDEAASNAALWLPAPADPFITPAVSSPTSEDADPSSTDGTGGSEPRVDESVTASDTAGDNGGTPSGTATDDSGASSETATDDAGTARDTTAAAVAAEETVADEGSDAAGEVADGPAADASTADLGDEAESDEDEDGRIILTRRTALAAITAILGGVSAGVLNTQETPSIEGFGYGGTPISSSASGAARATNNTTGVGSTSTATVERTASTSGSGQDPSGSTTETEGVGNTTTPEAVANTTIPGNASNTTPPGNANNTTNPGADVTTVQEPAGETTPDTSDASTAAGGNAGNAGAGGGGMTAGGDGSSGGGTETVTSSGSGNGEFGTVGYGQGGYGGVA